MQGMLGNQPLSFVQVLCMMNDREALSTRCKPYTLTNQRRPFSMAPSRPSRARRCFGREAWPEAMMKRVGGCWHTKARTPNPEGCPQSCENDEVLSQKPKPGTCLLVFYFVNVARSCQSELEPSRRNRTVATMCSFCMEHVSQDPYVKACFDHEVQVRPL